MSRQQAHALREGGQPARHSQTKNCPPELRGGDAEPQQVLSTGGMRHGANIRPTSSVQSQQDGTM